jgi:protoheme IX farnesyltransferase
MVALAGTRRRLADFLALAKPRVVLMVVLTTLVGYYLGASADLDYLRLFHVLVGTALAAGGTLALNQFLERDVDARMLRTRARPLPDGRLQPVEAAAFGTLVTVGGLAYLLLAAGPAAAAGTAATAALYRGV